MPVSRRTRHAEVDARSSSPSVRLADDGKTVIVEGDSGDSGSEEEDDDDEEDGEEEEGDDQSKDGDESDEEEDHSDADEDDAEGEDADKGEKPVQSKSQPTIESKAASKDPTSQPSPLSKPTPSSSSSSSSTHLDPSLFKSYFQSQSQARLTAPSILKPSSSSALKTNRPRKSKSKGGIVTGRDGLPMKRLKDGRTILRALSDSGPGSSRGQAAPREDLVDKVARTKAEKYRSRKLGLDLSGRSKGDTAPSKGASKSKPATTEDDPLGLNDPAFLPGGEFAHLANMTGAKKRKRKNKSSGGQTNIKNDKRTQRVSTSALPKKSAQSGMPAFGFRRSAA